MEKTTTVTKEVQLFETHLRAKNYADSTIGTCASVVRNFLRTIQELLGHSSTKITEIYTHVSKKRIASVPSPMSQALRY